MVKKCIIALIMLVCCIVIIICTSKTVTKVTYHGESFHWESTMIFDENDEYIFIIKYIGQE